MRGCFIFAAMLLAGAAPAHAALDLNRASVSHLPNGLTVIMLEDHTFPVVSVQALYKSGSAAEITGKTGLAHFLEHLAFRATQNFPNARATELIYDDGGEWHGYTAMDQTTYFSTMPSSQLDLLLRIEADRMARVVIDPAGFDAEKGAVITELHSYENDPALVLQDAVTRAAIQMHPYGSPMAGYVNDVEGLTIEDAKAYYSSHYAPGNAVLAVVGDFSSAQAQALVARDFADVVARPVAVPHFTAELPQRGKRRLELRSAVNRQHFIFAYHAPPASSPDFPAFMLLQQILAGGSGLNLRQTDWAPTTPAVKGSLLSGASDDIATWLPPTREPFLFVIGGSIGPKAAPAALEGELGRRIAILRNHPPTPSQLAEAKTAVALALSGDVETTEDAAHQLAFFEGLGGLDQLFEMPQLVGRVSATDIQRVARTYLAPDQLTVGWLVPGKPPASVAGTALPRNASDRRGPSPISGPAGKPQLRRLSGGLPAIVQANPLSDSVTVELLLSAAAAAGSQPDDLVGLDAIVRSGTPRNLAALLRDAALPQRAAAPVQPSEDPATRLQQLIVRQAGPRRKAAPSPLAIIVSGNIEPDQAFTEIEKQFGRTTAAKFPTNLSIDRTRTVTREKIDKAFAQGGLGYVVEGPVPGTRDALIWRMLLYVLTHDYSGRLGNSAIRDKGLVYHIYSLLRTDGHRTWATVSTGVDPDKADAMEAELRSQLTRLATTPPTQAEVDAARNHLLGRDLTAAQSNEELTAKLARQFVETGGLRSHEQLEGLLKTINANDLAAIAQEFAGGRVVRVDVTQP